MKKYIMYKESGEIKKVGHTKKTRQSEEEAWALAVPIEKVGVKQELKDFCKYADDIENQVNIKEEVFLEADLGILNNEDLFQSTHNEKVRNAKQTEETAEETCALAVPIQNVEVKRELKDFCKYTANIKAQVNIKEELDTEVDLGILKNEELLESTDTVPSKPVSKIIRKNKYLCLVCQKYYPSCKSRREHFLKHFKNQIVICNCGKLFIDAFLFLTHYFVHFVKIPNKSDVEINPLLDDKNRNPQISIKPFSDKRYSNNYSRINSGKISYRYRISLKQFSPRSSVLVHSRIHTNEKPYKNRICLKQLSQKLALALQSGTPIDAKKSYESNKPYKCPICLKQFSLSDLTRHSRIHTGEKPYKCKICLKQFSLKCNLISHCRIHSGEKPYKCQICLKKFSHSSALKRHSRIHTGEKPYECKICLKQFSMKGTLTEHSSIHSDKKPYKCEICLKQFYILSSFKVHCRIHTGEYKCQICLKQFASSSYLIRHSRIHSSEKPHECKICLRQFSRKGALTTHTRFHTD